MRRKSRFLLALVACITLIISVACSPSQKSALEITSADAITVTKIDPPAATRVIALANGSAEIISALGYKQNLIGRDIASTDEDLAQVPIVTSGHLVVAEKIIALNPDLILIDKSTGPATAIAALRDAGIKVAEIPEAWQVSDITGKVAAVASAMGTKAAGEELISALATSIESIGSKSFKEGKKPGIVFLYLRGGSAIYLIGGKGSGADSLITAIGGKDLGAAKLANPFNALSAELIASLNPDVILVMSKGLASVGGVTGLTQLPGVAQTSAGKLKRIIAVDDSLLLSFGPRTPNLLVQLNAALFKVLAN